MVIDSIASDPLLRRLIARLASHQEGVVHAGGLWGSSAPMVAALGIGSVPKTFLYVTAHAEEADDARDDLELFLGRAPELFPAWETVPGGGPGGGEIEAERLRLCTGLRGIQLGAAPAREAPVIVAPIQALMQPVPSPASLDHNTIRLVADSQSQVRSPAVSPDALVAWAVERGFERLDLVESPGDVARRGDIVDVFAPGESSPYRIQFFDDEIESIRRFDISTQRSMETLSEVAITALPNRNWLSSESIASVLDFLPSGSLIVLDGPGEIHEMGATLMRRVGEAGGWFDPSEVLAKCATFPQLHVSRFIPASASDEQVFAFDTASVARLEGSASEVVTELVRLGEDHDVHVLCDNDGERQRFAEMIAEQGGTPANPVRLSLGTMHHGFVWTRTRTVVVPHHELFHRHRHRRPVRRVYAGRPLESWTDLTPGDMVVHVVHGIAIYRGLHKIRKSESGQQEEFLTLEFADKAVVHVPTSQVDLVQKYIGAAGHRPQLSTLGGKRWSRIKEQVADAVSELAESLLRIQALRAEAVGTAYPPDTEWQREFEAAFVYEETEDQLRVATEIRDDLIRRRPMDRVVCGDVGYGKTELAMRGAFKVVEYGRQVAVLVPTTVLAEQHYETFRERMGDYPFSVGCLSRFRSAAEQKKILDKLKKGQIDIVIGTHRLLSKDVKFANLGLVIIDEEQRFGVEHKERLKAMRETVDVLTLTATPIPRTLHMSMVGLRDISSLQTPPMDRRAIATQVRPFDQKLIRDAILREMNRDGQVYFVHNYVHSIGAMADAIRKIVPEARVVYGHGQMKDDELEEVMHRFLRREADVLVATTIIESGIDIPTVNTIFINRAERFGLADLHQLRGRVGRSKHRAYCYLLLSPDRPPTSKAARRLKTIEEFSELGAGFRIAMRDLEIRGAGNLLGKEQSGHIAAVGYEMYCQLLERTVRQLKNEPDPTPAAVHLDLDVSAHIPQHYINSDRSRIEMYRRIVAARTSDDLVQLERDLTDAFGPYPKQVERLMELAEIRVLGRRFGVVSISRRPPDVIFKIESVPKAELLFVDAPGTVRMPDPNTVHLRLPPAYLEPTTLLPVLRRMLQKASSASLTPAASGAS